jgi:hypothetical protein
LPDLGKEITEYARYYEDRNDLKQQHGSRFGNVVYDSLFEHGEVTVGCPGFYNHSKLVMPGKMTIKYFPLLHQDIGEDTE